jgi:peptide/nickel transport system ATP-binding protein
MYAGRLVERAPASELFRAPRHPYTLGLLSSFPPLHGPRAAMTGIPGSPPDLRQLPSGCVFHPRCPFTFDRCSAEAPPLAAVGGRAGRLAACWLQDGSQPVPPELAAPEPDLAVSAPAGRPGQDHTHHQQPRGLPGPPALAPQAGASAGAVRAASPADPVQPGSTS